MLQIGGGFGVFVNSLRRPTSVVSRRPCRKNEIGDKKLNFDEIGRRVHLCGGCYKCKGPTVTLTIKVFFFIARPQPYLISTAQPSTRAHNNSNIYALQQKLNFQYGHFRPSNEHKVCSHPSQCLVISRHRCCHCVVEDLQRPQWPTNIYNRQSKLHLME